ncbi:MAG: glycosyltransferase family 87 protein [Anaerolineae bacterium]
MVWTPIRQLWAEKRWYRRALIAAGVFALLRLLLQFLLVTGAFAPAEMTGENFLPDDLRIYLDASRGIQTQQPLYPPLPLERMEFYQYAPSFALAFAPFTALPAMVNAILHTLLHLLFYGLLYGVWAHIFTAQGMESALRTQARLLPIWLLFAPFWSDLSYLNVYILMALLSSLLIHTVLTQKLAGSVVLLTVILQIKPQWAFAAVIPLVIGQYRFFFRLVGLAAGLYAVCTAVTVILVGIPYGLEQYSVYLNLLVGIGGNYPWRTPDFPFLGYNHSIAQIVVYWLGASAESLRLALVIKGLIVLPLALFGLRSLVHPVKTADGVTKLALAFALYAAAFIWLDVVWELSLSIAVFTFLLATAQRGWVRTLVWIAFLPYALVDAIQVISYVIFGDSILAPGPYILLDPSIYLPLTMITAVVFYAVLTARLWGVPSWQQHKDIARGSEHLSQTTH